MTHIGCKLKSVNRGDDDFNPLRKLFRTLRESTLVSSGNPLSLNYFRSPVAIRQEQQRQLKTAPFAIHPYSRFREWYDLYLIYLFGSTLITNPMQFGFIRRKHYVTGHFYTKYSMFTRILFLFHMPLNMCFGFSRKGSNTVELRFSETARRYIFGPYFICDFISTVVTIPISVAPWWFDDRHILMGITNVMSLFRIVRLVSLIICMQKVSRYMRSKSMGSWFLLYTFITLLMAVHWMACLLFGVPRLIRYYILESDQAQTWFSRYNLTDESVTLQYFQSFFKSSAYILGVRIAIIYQDKLPEEYIMAVLTYILGKILVAILWIVLAVAILNGRSMDIKFLELMNQLDEYMKRKQLPLKLRERISQYYHFKYKSKYVNEDLVSSMLSSNLKNEVNMHVCKSLIESVALFSNLNVTELNNVVQYLIPEIFLPNDTIFQHGTYGDAMYFLSSGTVAVYTYSGKEICHLQDGAYFGEISLLLKGQTRTATIVAIETSQVYRLDRKKFDETLLKNKQVIDKMLSLITKRLEDTAYKEEQYKKALFEKTFQRKVS